MAGASSIPGFTTVSARMMIILHGQDSLVNTMHINSVPVIERCVANISSYSDTEQYILFALNCVAQVLIQPENSVVVYLVCFDDLVELSR